MTPEQEKAAQAELAKNAAAERKKEIDDAVALALKNYDEERQKKAPKTAEEFIASAPEGIREQFSEGQRILKGRKDTLVKVLSEHKSKAYSKEELEKMPLADLERIARIANVATAEDVDFSGRGAPVAQNAESTNSSLSDDDGAPEPIRAFNYGPEAKKDKETTNSAKGAQTEAQGS